mmetsp:Transcript_41849/g.131179  ORF Transcript_41849/g.131179 Transcript_41849/m.131179 type:complete len:443 (+) Transcript_41849:554-1882(+)
MLLLEERHRAGRTDYLPEVMEKETAQKKFEQAAASSTHSASLSNADDEFFEVKIDKIAPGADANFTVCLLQPQTKEVDMVVADSDEDAAAMADVVVMPGVAAQEDEGQVPFGFEVTFSEEYEVGRVPYDVAKDSLAQLEVFDKPSEGWWSEPGSTPPRALVVLQPGEGRVRFAAPAGLCTSCVLLARLQRRKVNPMLAELTASMKGASVGEGPAPARAVVQPRVFFDPADGTPRSFSNVEVTVPSTLPDVGPSEVPHRVYLIVDVSGSTSLTVEGSTTFLQKCVAFLQGMVRTLPKHVAALRARGAINSQPVTVHLWAFQSDTKRCATCVLPAAPEAEMLAALEKDLLEQAGALRSGGCTNYDSFSSQLATSIETTEPHLNHVLLFTDGGATSMQRFQDNVRAIAAHPSATFFQADCLGYGPWLNPATVTWLAQETDGEVRL